MACEAEEEYIVSKKAEIAADLFHNSFNCGQAIFGAFSEDYGLEKDTALKIAGGLSSGMRSGEVCGAVAGAVLVIGLKYGHTKRFCYERTEEFTAKFKEENKHLACRDLLGYDISTPEGRAKAIEENMFRTICVDMVVSAADILVELGY